MSAQLGFAFDDPAPAPPPVPAASIVIPIANPAGGTIRAAQGGAMEPAAVTGQPPVVAGSPLCDGIAECAIAGSRNMLVPWFLVASWAYYVGDQPLISDGLFDRLCRDLDADWDSIEHKHKHLVDRAWLAAGTCGLAREAYPPSVRGAAAHLAWTSAGVRIPRE